MLAKQTINARAQLNILTMRKAGKFNNILVGSLWLIIGTIPLGRFKIPILVDSGLKPVWVASFIFILAFLLCLSGRKQKIRKTEGGFGILIGLVAVLSYLSVDKVSLGFSPYIRQSTRLLYNVTLFVCISSTRLSQKVLRKTFKVWLGIAGIVSILTIYNSISLNTQLSTFISQQDAAERLTVGGYVRPGIVTEPVVLCEYLLPPLAFILVLATGSGLNRVKKIVFENNWVNISVLTLIISAYFVTFSMGGFISLVLLATLYVFFISKKSVSGYILRYSLYTVLVFSFSSLVIYGLTGLNLLYGMYVRLATTFTQTFGIYEAPTSDFATTSVYARLEAIRAALSSFLENPIIGAGLGSIPSSQGGESTGVHGGFIQLLGEIGLFGLIIFLSLTYYTVRTCYLSKKKYTYKSNLIISKAIATSVISRLVFMLIQGGWVNINTWFIFSFGMMVVNSMRRY